VALLLGLATPARAAAPATVHPADAALDWLAHEVEANDGMLTVDFDGEAFADEGLTIDALLALLAGGHGDDPAVGLGLDALAAAIGPYVTGFSTEAADRAANAVAKALFLELVAGRDISPAYELEPDLRSLMATDGDEVGRFNDTDLLGYGNFSNGIGQAFAVLALDRTSAGVPSPAVDFLLSQQCSDGSFRLYYYGYVVSYDPFVTVDDLTCVDPAEGDADATAFALMALLAGPASPAVDAAIDDAVAHLLGLQDGTGGFLGTGAVNSNTTGVAAAVVRTAGATEEADAGAAFVAGVQATDDCTELGALAYDATAFAAGVDADRGQWTRATAQGVLALGLPDYGSIGSTPPVDAGLAPIGCADTPPPTTPPTDPPAAPAPSITLRSTTVTLGGLIEGSGEGFAAGEEVRGTLVSTPSTLGSVAADDGGAVTFSFTVPTDLEPGVHTFALTGQTSGLSASAEIEVLAVAEPGTLPRTGSATGVLAAVGCGLLLAGGGLVGLGRRRIA